MIIQDKQELIYRSILVILIIVFLAIFYGYSENGRYTSFHRETGGMYEQYLVDSRTGTVCGEIRSAVSPYWQFYVIELPTGKVWNRRPEVIQSLHEQPKSAPSK